MRWAPCPPPSLRRRLAASAFGALDLLLQLTVRPVLARLLRPVNEPATARASPVVVSKALVIAVSFVHLAIQVGHGGARGGAALCRVRWGLPPRAAAVGGARCSRARDPIGASAKRAPTGALLRGAARASAPRRPPPNPPPPPPLSSPFPAPAPQIPIGLAVLRDPRLAADPVYGVSAPSCAMVVISSGYFLYDLATVMLRYDTDGPAFLVHALCCLFVYGYAVFYNTLHWFGARASGLARARPAPARRRLGRATWASALRPGPAAACERPATRAGLPRDGRVTLVVEPLFPCSRGALGFLAARPPRPPVPPALPRAALAPLAPSPRAPAPAGAAFLMWELSTPFVHVRYLMHATGRSGSPLYIANGLTMVLVFFCCRNLWGVWCSYQFFRATQAELDAPREGGFSPAGIWGYRIANVSLNALNALWFSKMATKAAQLLLGKGGKGGKGGAAAGPKKQH
jgi:hypothetical protein